MDARVDKDLEIYIESNMRRAAPQSIEGKAKAVRFGAKNDGVYARLTDKARKAGDLSRLCSLHVRECRTAVSLLG
jgi:hypothetical protein